ncbi:hypothetical protein IKQ21_04480 [bacterium]|nr:hypothetical protein [bacterium]
MKTNPVKRFFTSLYYANKPIEYAKQKRVQFQPSIHPDMTAKIRPYIEGIEQLAEKYDFYIDISRHAASKDSHTTLIRLSNEDAVMVNNSMSSADIAKKVYEKVGQIFLHG